MNSDLSICPNCGQVEVPNCCSDPLYEDPVSLEILGTDLTEELECRIRMAFIDEAWHPLLGVTSEGGKGNVVVTVPPDSVDAVKETLEGWGFRVREKV